MLTKSKTHAHIRYSVNKYKMQSRVTFSLSGWWLAWGTEDKTNLN